MSIHITVSSSCTAVPMWGNLYSKYGNLVEVVFYSIWGNLFQVKSHQLPQGTLHCKVKILQWFKKQKNTNIKQLFMSKYLSARDGIHQNADTFVLFMI